LCKVMPAKTNRVKNVLAMLWHCALMNFLKLMMIDQFCRLHERLPDAQYLIIIFNTLIWSGYFFAYSTLLWRLFRENFQTNHNKTFTETFTFLIKFYLWVVPLRLLDCYHLVTVFVSDMGLINHANNG